MKKSDKKLDNLLRKALTIACENIKDKIPDFNWLTHEVNYQQYPTSLIIRCYVNHQQTVDKLIETNQLSTIHQAIERQLNIIGINKFNANKQIKLAVDC